MNHTNESKYPIADGHERPQGVMFAHWTGDAGRSGPNGSNRPQPVFAGTELIASKRPLMGYSHWTVPRRRLMTAVPKIRFALGLGRGLAAYAVT
jgi:hypothetical protein